MSEALVVIDFVNDIVNERGQVAQFGAPKHVAQQNALGNAAKALEHARTIGTKVIFTRVCFSEGYPELDGVTAPFYVGHKVNGWLKKGTWGTEFDPAVKPLEDELVLDKARVNPFWNPRLITELEGIDTVYVMGVTTNFAVEEFVRNGAALGLNIVVLEDCCASNSAELHAFSLENVLPKFSTLSNSTEYVGE